MKYYVKDRNIRYKGKSYEKGNCIEAKTEEEKKALEELVKEGYLSKEVVNIGPATKIIERERVDLNLEKEELRKKENFLNSKQKELEAKEAFLNNFEECLDEREAQLIEREKGLDKVDDSEMKINDEIYKKFTKKEKATYDALSEDEKNTVKMFETYEDVKAYLVSITSEE